MAEQVEIDDPRSYGGDAPSQNKVQGLIRKLRETFSPPSAIRPPAGELDYSDRGVQNKVMADRVNLSPSQFRARYGDSPEAIVRRFGK